jgi:hypothetical protein
VTKEIAMLIIGAVMAIGGTIMLYHAIKSLKKAKDALTWPAVKGTIQKLKLKGVNPPIVGEEDSPYPYRRYMVDLAYA